MVHPTRDISEEYAEGQVRYGWQNVMRLKRLNTKPVSDISGVANIDVAINGVAMGRLRVSLKHGRARFDYTDIDGKMHFLHSADECTAYINPTIQNVTL